MEVNSSGLRRGFCTLVPFIYEWLLSIYGAPSLIFLPWLEPCIRVFGCTTAKLFWSELQHQSNFHTCLYECGLIIEYCLLSRKSCNLKVSCKVYLKVETIRHLIDRPLWTLLSCNRIITHACNNVHKGLSIVHCLVVYFQLPDSEIL